MRFIKTLLLCLVCSGAGYSSTNKQHAAILGELVYRDLTISFDGENGSSVMKFLEDELNVPTQIYWKTKNTDGCNRSALVSLKLNEQPALVVLERVIEQLHEDEDATWQLRDGVLEVGLKSRFSKRGWQKLITYPIADLLFTIRDFEAPELNPSGGSGSMSPTTEPNEPSKQEQIDRIVELITTFVEPEQWELNGGECTITNYRDTLLIRAPDFIHRQIGGYPFEPIKPKDIRIRRVQYSKGKTLIRVPRHPKQN